VADRRFGLGIVSVAFGHETSQAEAARRAADLGFDHIDVSLDRPLPRGPLALPVVDRLILRLAATELLDPDGPPVAVVIDEAVALAKTYSTDDSGRFVNGVLSTVATRARG